jgi:SAM-dependent methyltransferase
MGKSLPEDYRGGFMSKQKIPLTEVKFHPHSFGDYHVRLFQWQGELYRGISAEGVPFFRKLFEDGIVENLTQQGLLIDSEFTPLVMDGYEMVVRHRSISFTSYPQEWCGAMFKDAALTIINLAIALAEQGFSLGDAHPWNILFDLATNKPIFVDLGSIGKVNDSRWLAFDEFCHFCLYPLILISQRQEKIARLLLCEDRGILKSDLLLLTQGSATTDCSSNTSILSRLEAFFRDFLPPSSRQYLRKSLSLISSSSTNKTNAQEDFLENVRQKSHLAFLKQIKADVERITLTNWSEGAGEQGLRPHLRPNFSSAEGWTAKQQNIHKILTKLQPTSVLDIGCGTGWYSQLAAILGSKVVAFDINEAYITQLYYDSCSKHLPILPLIMDFTKSTPSRGLADHWAIAATKRFQCDLVMALAVLDDLVFKQRLNFEQIIEGLGQFSKKWAIVEFIPSEDSEFAELWSERVDWYSLDNAIAALKKHFPKVTILPSYPEGRVLLLCEK